MRLSRHDVDALAEAGYQPGGFHIEAPRTGADGGLTIPVLARVSDIPVETIYKWVQTGDLKTCRPASGGIYIDEVDFVECAEKKMGYRTKVLRVLDPDHFSPHMPREAEPRLVTITEANEILGIKPDRLRKWASRDQIKAKGRRGNANLYDIDDICELAAKASPAELVKKAQAAISFALDVLEDTDLGDMNQIIAALRTAQSSLETVILGRAA